MKRTKRQNPSGRQCWGRVRTSSEVMVQWCTDVHSPSVSKCQVAASWETATEQHRHLGKSWKTASGFQSPGFSLSLQQKSHRFTLDVVLSIQICWVSESLDISFCNFSTSEHGKLTIQSHWLGISSNLLPCRYMVKLPLVSQPLSSASISVFIPSKYGKKHRALPIV